MSSLSNDSSERDLTLTLRDPEDQKVLPGAFSPTAQELAQIIDEHQAPQEAASVSIQQFNNFLYTPGVMNTFFMPFTIREALSYIRIGREQNDPDLVFEGTLDLIKAPLGIVGGIESMLLLILAVTIGLLLLPLTISIEAIAVIFTLIETVLEVKRLERNLNFREELGTDTLFRLDDCFRIGDGLPLPMAQRLVKEHLVREGPQIVDQYGLECLSEMQHLCEHAEDFSNCEYPAREFSTSMVAITYKHAIHKLEKKYLRLSPTETTTIHRVANENFPGPMTQEKRDFIKQECMYRYAKKGRELGQKAQAWAGLLFVSNCHKTYELLTSSDPKKRSEGIDIANTLFATLDTQQKKAMKVYILGIVTIALTFITIAVTLLALPPLFPITLTVLVGILAVMRYVLVEGYLDIEGTDPDFARPFRLLFQSSNKA